jgi:hypothetical protein
MENYRYDNISPVASKEESRRLSAKLSTLNLALEING